MSYELLIATRKGLLIGRSEDRASWSLSEPSFLGEQVDYAVRDPRDGRIYASTAHMQWGPHLFASDDATWSEIPAPMFAPGETYPASPLELAQRDALVMDEERGEWSPRLEASASLERIWTVVPGAASQPGRLYLGVAPAGVFTSDDSGQSWELNRPLWEHPTRGLWVMGVTSVSDNVFGSAPACDDLRVDPTDPEHMIAVVQTAGLFETHDGGASWEARQRGLRDDHLPGGGLEMEAGHDVHSFQWHPADRSRMYVQHHSGVLASRNGGADWDDIAASLAAALGHEDDYPLHGFASAIDPHDPEVFYVVPHISDQQRVPVDGHLRVCRTSDGGVSWEALGAGLPDHFYQGAYRQALTHDDHPEPGSLGLYLGTNGGHVFASPNGGESWSEVASSLAPVTAVRCAEV